MPQPLTRNDVVLEKGRVIHLRSLEQWGTYSGLLEGIPTREMNHRHIKRTMDAAREKYRFEPFLIPPVETLIDGFPGYRFGTPAQIPSITCVATFDCFSIARDESMDASTLPVVWFQSDLAFPIADNILASLRLLKWEEVASDFQY
ncbi:MAG: hypothetical protein J0M26_18380 [Planctomycetes bacterium]|nr:hypothetical protein [Planctomycetota bacterium]